MLLLTNQPILSYNLTVLSLLLLNFFLAYLLFAELFDDKKLVFLGAMGYGFSFYNLARAAGHMNLLGTGSFALLLLSLIKLRSKPSWKNFLLFSLAYTLIIYSSLQYLLFTLILIPLIGLLLVIFYPKQILNFLQTLSKNILKLVISLIIISTLTLPFLFPFMKTYLAGYFISHHQNTNFNPNLAKFIIPDAYLRVPLSQFSGQSEYRVGIEFVVYLGWLEIILFLVFLTQNQDKKQTWFFSVTALIFFTLSLGSINPDTGLTLPYLFLSKYFPFSSIPESGRFTIFLNLTILLGVANYLKQSKTKSKYLLAILLIMFFERFSWGNFYRLPAENFAYLSAVHAQDSQATLNIPLNMQHDSFYPYFYGKAVLGGEAHWLANTKDSLEFLDDNRLSRFMCDQKFRESEQIDPKIRQELNQKLLAKLSDNQINTLVLRKDANLYWPSCQNVLQETSILFPSFLTAKETLINSNPAQYFWADKSLDSGLFFPKSGYVTIFGFSLQPKEIAVNLTLKINEDNILLNQKDKYLIKTETDSVIFEFTQITPIKVDSGSKLEFKSPQVVESGTLTIWYTYKPDVNSQTIQLEQNGLKRVYFDEFKEVYQILP